MSEALKNFRRRISGGPREEQAIAFLRVATGLFFAYLGHQKLTNPHFAAELAAALNAWAAHNPIEPYKGFLLHIAAPNAGVLAPVITYGEIFVGLSYALGFLVPVSAIGGAFLNLNILLATQHTSAAALGINLAFLLIHLALFWGRAGQHYGFDAFIFRPQGKPPEKPAYGKSSKKLKTVKNVIEQAKKPGGKKSKSKPF